MNQLLSTRTAQILLKYYRLRCPAHMHVQITCRELRGTTARDAVQMKTTVQMHQRAHAPGAGPTTANNVRLLTYYSFVLET